MKRKLLLVTNMYPDEQRPYFGIFVKEQKEAYEDFGYEVTLVNVDLGEDKSKYWRGRALVKEALSKQAFDCAHIHYGLTGISCMGLPMPPSITTFHGADVNYPSQRPFSIFTGLASQYWVFVSQLLADKMPAPGPYEVIPCGIPEKKYTGKSREEAKKKLGLDPQKPAILFPAHPENLRKNFALFEEVLTRLSDDVQVLKFGEVKPEDTPDYYYAADVTLLTSLSEGSPQVVKESIFAGTPVVSVNVGDVDTYLPEIEGCSVHDYDAIELSKGVEQAFLFSHSGKKASRESIEPIYGITAVTKRLDQIFTSII